MSLKSAAENYFSSINPIASRLYSDLNEIKSSYEDLWNTLPEKEQQEILTDSIIKPEISIKYLKKRKNHVLIMLLSSYTTGLVHTETNIQGLLVSKLGAKGILDCSTLKKNQLPSQKQ
ncbi:unnamed protein product [Acanthoscelides obtectus]|uniref:DUF4706 domain-containing protein n=1 Tax=Acanthoscelides obtectus TaxID=200917 RepID=A0A9P0QA95_ACAOB|nr:unnamed protein product [Acanthoscelides obtectus]CAK1684522.1 hypothetical protein AOBTE_LOCUS34907 [Acanthoscelides obtectus]